MKATAFYWKCSDSPTHPCHAGWHCSDVQVFHHKSRELAGRNIRVNAVMPGATETPIYVGLPQEVKDAVANDSVMKRLAQPEEIAGAVAFLCSNDASFATGSTVTVNGGSWFI